MRQVLVSGALIFFAAVGLGAQNADYPPGTFELTPEMDLGLEAVPLEVPPQFADLVPEDIQLNLPAGFSAKVFAAEGLRGPRFMAWSPEGVLHVANMKVGGASQFGPPNDGDVVPPLDEMTGQIVALPDADGDGVADEVIVVAQNLWWANNMEFYQGDLYVGDRHAVRRFSDSDGDGIYETEAEPVALLPPSKQHRTRTLVLDEARGKFYVSVGSTCDVCREEDPERAAVLEFNLDGSGRRLFARGLRNGIGMALHPLTGELWATNNGHDREGRSLPPEWIDIVRDGGFYGWPLAYGYQVWTDFSISAYENALFPLTAQDSTDVFSMARPVALVPAHLAPMAIHFYTQDRFPAPYKNQAFVAFRGGGNAAVPGFKVMALFSEPDGSAAQVGDFLTGFEPWGKPVGVTSGADGALYVSSDWITHAVIRIVPGRLQGSWQNNLPEQAFTGERIELEATVEVQQGAEDGGAVAAFADLSQLGGAERLALEALEDGRFRLQTTITLGDVPGPRQVVIHLEQALGGEVLRAQLRQQLKVFAGEDLVVVGDALAPQWSQRSTGGAELLPFGDGPALVGDGSGAVEILDTSSLGWTLTLAPEQAIDLEEYTSLSLAFLPAFGELPRRPRLSLTLRPGRSVDLLESVDLENGDWQVLSLPLDVFEVEGSLESLSFAGNIEGVFYLDDLRLVSGLERPITAVLSAVDTGAPADFGLGQNYPNPFNSSTLIRFDLAEAGPVELAVYNLAGQQVAVLVDGVQGAGSYAVHWDGRAAAGGALASGMYLYRLRAGAAVQTRKMLLLR